MKLSLTASLLAMLLALSRNSLAASHPCQNPMSTADVVACVELAHPDIRKLAQNQLQIEGVRKAALQFPNPQLNFQTTKGQSFGDVQGEDALAVSELIEIGGKRSARQKAAEAQSNALLANADLTKAQARMQGLLQLIRYRQLSDEIGVLKEALQTYGRVHNQFASRPRLSPDQQVTFSLFNLSMGDYRHKLAALEAELRKSENFFRVIPELNVSQALKFLPRKLQKWPVIPQAPIDFSKTPSGKIANSDLEQAQAAHDLANANAIPDPTVSLVAIRTIEGPALFYKYGVGLSIPIPILNWNGGERSQAAALKAKAEIDYAKTNRQIQLDRDNLIISYQGFVKSLDAAPSVKDIESKHRNTESLFYRGVISGVLVIEAHRQILEFTQSQNELEFETAQALMNLYLLDGKLGGFNYE